VSDREKAYAEARARIFGEGAEGASPEGSTPPPATAAASAEAPAAAAVPTVSQHSDSVGAGGGRGRGRQGRAVVNAGGWKEKKVTMRNKDAERFDPDFTRHSPRGQWLDTHIIALHILTCVDGCGCRASNGLHGAGALRNGHAYVSATPLGTGPSHEQHDGHGASLSRHEHGQHGLLPVPRRRYGWLRGTPTATPATAAAATAIWIIRLPASQSILRSCAPAHPSNLHTLWLHRQRQLCARLLPGGLPRPGVGAGRGRGGTRALRCRDGTERPATHRSSPVRA
jgi:hypothetical protein